VSEHIPDTQLTDKLRACWQVLQEFGCEPAQSFEDYYREQSAGGTDNGRSLAALLFYRAREYWPDYFCPADLPAVALWGSMLDQYPILTPDVIELAVDKVHEAGLVQPQPANFIWMARQLSGEVL
jgi:hypothetical protein